MDLAWLPRRGRSEVKELTSYDFVLALDRRQCAFSREASKKNLC